MRSRVDVIDGKFVLKKEITYGYCYLSTVFSKHWPLSSAIRPSPTPVVASSPSASGKPVFLSVLVSSLCKKSARQVISWSQSKKKLNTYSFSKYLWMDNITSKTSSLVSWVISRRKKTTFDFLLCELFYWIIQLIPRQLWWSYKCFSLRLIHKWSVGKSCKVPDKWVEVDGLRTAVQILLRNSSSLALDIHLYVIGLVSN